MTNIPTNPWADPEALNHNRSFDYLPPYTPSHTTDNTSRDALDSEHDPRMSIGTNDYPKMSIGTDDYFRPESGVYYDTRDVGQQQAFNASMNNVFPHQSPINSSTLPGTINTGLQPHIYVNWKPREKKKRIFSFPEPPSSQQPPETPVNTSFTQDSLVTAASADFTHLPDLSARQVHSRKSTDYQLQRASPTQSDEESAAYLDSEEVANFRGKLILDTGADEAMLFPPRGPAPGWGVNRQSVQGRVKLPTKSEDLFGDSYFPYKAAIILSTLCGFLLGGLSWLWVYYVLRIPQAKTSIQWKITTCVVAPIMLFIIVALWKFKVLRCTLTVAGACSSLVSGRVMMLGLCFAVIFCGPVTNILNNTGKAAVAMACLNKTRPHAVTSESNETNYPSIMPHSNSNDERFAELQSQKEMPLSLLTESLNESITALNRIYKSCEQEDHLWGECMNAISNTIDRCETVSSAMMHSIFSIPDSEDLGRNIVAFKESLNKEMCDKEPAYLCDSADDVLEKLCRSADPTGFCDKFLQQMTAICTPIDSVRTSLVNKLILIQNATKFPKDFDKLDDFEGHDDNWDIKNGHNISKKIDFKSAGFERKLKFPINFQRKWDRHLDDRPLEDQIFPLLSFVRVFVLIIGVLASQGWLYHVYVAYSYTKQFLISDVFDNIYITNGFRSYDRSRSIAALMELQGCEHRKYQNIEKSRWSGWTLLQALLIVAFAFAISFLFYWLDHILFKFMHTSIYNHIYSDGAKIVFGIRANMVLESKLCAYSNDSLGCIGGNYSHFEASSVDRLGCLQPPTPLHWSYVAFSIVIFGVMMILAFVNDEGYRLRYATVAWFYPKRHNQRCVMLYREIAKIRQKGPSYTKAMVEQTLSELERSLQLPGCEQRNVATTCTTCMSHRKPRTKCTSCRAVYCIRCWKHQFNKCPACDY